MFNNLIGGKEMTDEQIKQNAEAYCDENFSPLDVDRRQYAEEDFIAGAHSRDEEIEKYKSRILELQRKLIELGEF